MRNRRRCKTKASSATHRTENAPERQPQAMHVLLRMLRHQMVMCRSWVQVLGVMRMSLLLVGPFGGSDGLR